jgi:hypothetical protein
MNPNSKEFTKACDTYCDAMAAKQGTKAALKKSGLSHSQADRAWYASELNPARTVAEPKFLDWTAAEQAAFVVEERAKGLSWGRIAIRTGFVPRTNSGPAGCLSEGQVQGLFSRTTGIAAEGTRSNKGGRHLQDNPLFYTGNRRGMGTEDAAPRKLNPADEKFQAAKDKVKSKLPAKVAAAKKAAAKAVAPVAAEEEVAS